jgi:hypothetical protein
MLWKENTKEIWRKVDFYKCKIIILGNCPFVSEIATLKTYPTEGDRGRGREEKRGREREGERGREREREGERGREREREGERGREREREVTKRCFKLQPGCFALKA